MNWRPDGWENPHKDHWGKHNREMTVKEDCETDQHFAYEAGADAMLKGLYDQCQKHGGKWMRFDKTYSGDILIYVDA